ncbi:MAG TPA: Ldh family oxidoreductase [Stellaceae bacterium]|nr:Ldh family oxidoreductase [Stellaceae bacterium]
MSSILHSRQEPDHFDPMVIGLWIGQVFRACGVPARDADRVAGILLRTSLRGIDTHGVTRVRSYVEKLQSGAINPTPKLSATSRNGMLVCEVDQGLGQIAMPWAMAQAMTGARKQACQPFLVRGTGHLDAIGMFVLEAAEAGMVALIAKTTPPLMAPVGGRRAAIGNNPLAFAMPLAGAPPLVFDAAMSMVGRSKLHAAARDGKALGEQWAIGPDGAVTCDATSGLEGALLPIGGHKGIGLAMMIQCLAGSLGASVPAGTGGADETGLFGLVINPALIHGRVAFEAESAAWLATYLDAAGPEARYPGARAAACEAERLQAGLPLAPNIIADLQHVAAIAHCPFNPADWSVSGDND